MSIDPIYKRILLKLSGEALMGDLGFGLDLKTVQKDERLFTVSGNPNNGNDCWGFVSPSGREYALMGTSSGTAVVEITNPGPELMIRCNSR